MNEFMAFDSTNNDVAYGKMTTQSSTYNGDMVKFGSGNAVDNITNSFSHTDVEDMSASWTVDLGQDSDITSVSVHNRYCGTDPADPKQCLCRLSYANVELLDSTDNVISTASFGNTCSDLKPTLDFNTCSCPAKKIKLESTTGTQLQLFELMAYSGGEHVALESATQSSILKGDAVKFGPLNSIDLDNGTFAHTDDESPWLEVELTSAADISEIVIYNRWCGSELDPKNCLCRLTNASLSLLDDNDNVLNTKTLGDTCGQSLISEAFSCAPSTSPTASPTEKNTTVLILGAGAAGLAAAYELEQANFTNYLIIEASDRMDGRMKSIEFGGRASQVGANWVVGTEGSWLWDLVQEANISGTFSDWDNVDLAAYVDNSTWHEYWDQLLDAWDRENVTLECMTEVSYELWDNEETDMSLRQAQKLCGWLTFQDKFSEVVEYFTFDFEYAEPPVTTSLKNGWPNIAHELYKAEDYQINDRMGWQPVFDLFNIPASKFIFDTTVTNIENDGMGGVIVTAETGTGNETEEVILTADYTICTFSLGVLQYDHESLFSPPLPDWYLRSMYRQDMNTYTIIHMRFNYTFWDNSTYLFLHADERRGYYPIWENRGLAYEDEEYHVLTVTVTGEEALRITRQPVNETEAEAMEVLRTMFGPDIPDCLEFYVPNWLEDPLFRGSYTSWAIGLTHLDAAELSTPIDHVFIRGEATSPELNGWIHGALLEGRQTAREVMACLDDEYSDFCQCTYNRTCSTYDMM